MTGSMRWAAALAVTVALAVGYLIGNGVGGNRANAQPAAGATARSWPPAPKDIVNLIMPKEQKVKTSLGMDSYFVYDVPADKALVVTDVSAETNPLVLWEDANGKVTWKVNAVNATGQSPRYSSCVGAVFAPGSKVFVMVHTTSFHLTGYLTTP